MYDWLRRPLPNLCNSVGGSKVSGRMTAYCIILILMIIYMNDCMYVYMYVCMYVCQVRCYESRNKNLFCMFENVMVSIRIFQNISILH